MLKIVRPGLLTTVQDLGRTGFMKLGVPRSGAMDRDAAISANRAVGNPDHAALLEITLQGPEIEFNGPLRIAVAGARFRLYLNNAASVSSLFVQRGDRLRFGKLLYGCRAYLAVEGGIDVRVVMGSRSTDLRGRFGGYKGRALKVDDCLSVGSMRPDSSRAHPPPQFFRSPAVLNALPGPEWDRFPLASQAMLSRQSFVVLPESDRMGYRLEGPTLAGLPDTSMTSSGIVPGTLQVTPDGRSVLTMMDGQTTGGYPRPLVLKASDLSAAARLKPGDQFVFNVQA